MVIEIYFLTVVFLGSAIFCLCVAIFLRKPFLKLSTLAIKQLDFLLDSTISENEKDQLIFKNLGKLIISLLIFFMFFFAHFF